MAMRRRRFVTALAYVLMAGGVLSMVLGIFEVGDLFAVFVGVVALSLGVLLALGDDDGGGADGDFERLLRGS